MSERNTTEEGCGRIIGHGEFCSKGWLCGECKVKATEVKITKSLPPVVVELGTIAKPKPQTMPKPPQRPKFIKRR